MISSSRRWPPWSLLLPVAVVSVLLLLPVGYLFYYSVTSVDDVESLWSLPMQGRFFRTACLVAGVTGCVTVLGSVIAFLTVRTNLWGRGIISVLVTCPLAIPPYVTAYSLLSLGGDDGLLVRMLGAESAFLQYWFVDSETGRFHVPRLSGYWGSFLALVLYNLPYVYLPVRGAIHNLDVALEEATFSLGRGRTAVLFLVIGPQLLPALLAGMMLVSLHVLADFGVVSLMRYDTLSAALYARFNTFDIGNASRLAMVLVVVAIIFMVIEWLFLKRFRIERSGGRTGRAITSVSLGFWQVPALTVCLLVFAGGVVLPVVTTLYWMGQLPDLAIWISVRKALWGSITASLPAALLAPLLAIPIAALSVRYPGKTTAVLERLPLAGYSVPALALGLSLIMLCMAPWVPDAVYRIFYQSLPLLVLAYVLHFLAEAVGPIRSSLKLTSPRLEEAAQSLGSSPTGALWRVTLPIIRHGLIVAAVLVFLSCMKELPLTILLSPLGMETLARNAWDHAENAEFAKAAPYALSLLCASAGIVGLLLFERKRR